MAKTPGNKTADRPAYQPWYEGDFWTLRVRALPRMARLMYRALLQSAWDLEIPCLIPNDVPTIREMADCPDDKTWTKYEKPLLAMFDLSEDGTTFTNKRQMEELHKYYEKKASWSERGQKGNDVRWHGNTKKTRKKSSNSDKQGSQIIPVRSNSDPLAKFSDPPPVSQPDQSRPVQTSPVSKDGALQARLLPEFPEWLPVVSWNAFVDSRKKLKSEMTPEAAKRLVTELGKLRTRGNDPEAVLNESIMRGWRGVFPLKDFTGQPTPTRGRDATADLDAQLGVKQ